MKARVLLVAALTLCAVGCRHLSKDNTVCPEHRNLTCASGVECTMDRARGCQVCQCASPYTPPNALSPQRP